MKKQKIQPKLLVAFIFGLLLLLSAPLTVSANGPGAPYSLVVRFDGRPAGVAYVDLLVSINPQSDYFQQYNDEYGRLYSIGADSEIVNYSEDGYYSYTFHFVGASPGMKIERETLRGDQYYDVVFESGAGDLLGKADYFKIALLDESGAILHVTQHIRIAYNFTGLVQINGTTLEITDNGWYASPFSQMLLLPLLIIPRMAFSVLVEVFIAYLFKIAPLRRVVWLNIITQVALTMFMSITTMAYWRSVIVGEICVYLVEGVAMILLYEDINNRRLISFTVVANTTTLLLGILLNHLGIFRY